MSAIFLDIRAVRQQVERLKLDFPEMAEDAELLADSIEGETGLHEVLTRLVRQEREAATLSEAIKSREEELSERRARFVKRQQIARQLMLSLLETAEQSKIVLPEATVSVSNTAPRPVVENETAVPDEFCRFKRSPDLTAIKDAFKAGKIVPGARMSNGATSLTIRVR